MSAVERALKAVSEGRPTSTVGRKPKGEVAGVKLYTRFDPVVIIELHELTGLEVIEAVSLFVFAARRAKRGANDNDLAETVRSWLRKDAA